MPITFPCEKCSKPLRVPDDAAGKKSRCPACGEVSTAPADEEPVLEVVETPPAPPVERNPRRIVAAEADDATPMKLSDEPPPPRPKKRKKRRGLGPNRRVDYATTDDYRQLRNSRILYTVFGVAWLVGAIAAMVNSTPKVWGPLLLFAIICFYIAWVGDFTED